MIAFVSAGAAFWGCMMLLGWAGPAVPSVQLVSALIALVFVTICGLGDREARRSPLRWVVWLAATAVMLISPAPWLRTLAFGLAIEAGAAATLVGLGPALILVALASELFSWIPGVSEVAAEWATSLGSSFRASGWEGDQLDFGPSAAGLPMAGAALIVLVARLIHLRKSVWPLIGLALAGGAVLIQWQLGELIDEFYGPHAGHGHPSEMGIFSWLQPLSVLLAISVAVGWGRRVRELDSDAPQSRLVKFSVAAVLVAAGLSVLFSGWRMDGEPDRRVAFLNMGGLDWERPVFGEFGGFTGGMFGLLPIYMDKAGFEVRTITKEELKTFDRDRAQTLILINLHKIWKDEERERLEAFVASGGSLLILGDHTDVFGSMKGFNSLIEPWGMSFKFDSAYHTGKGWQDDLAWKAGDLGYWRSVNKEGIGIGASLAIEYPARSLVQARYAFSDWGLADNFMGSFLGNYRWDRTPGKGEGNDLEDSGERLGDLVMVASRRIGKGKVIAYGDTSGFQNGGLDTYYGSHIHGLLETLARPAGIALPPAVETGFAIAALLLAGLAVLFGGAAARGGLGLGCAVLFGGSLIWPAPDLDRPLAVSDLEHSFVIDYSHFPNIGHYEAGWNTIAPIESNAARSDLLPYEMRTWDPEVIRKATAVAIIAPRRRIEPEEVEQLVEAMRGGTSVIVAASAPEAPSLDPLLTHFGVRIARQHLGEIPKTGRQEEQEPRFKDPAPLEIDPARDEARQGKLEPIYSYGSTLIAAAISVGEGHLIVIGDSRYFSVPNTEGLWGWWAGNLQFQHAILLTFCNGDPDRVKEVFDKPERPPQ